MQPHKINKNIFFENVKYIHIGKIAHIFNDYFSSVASKIQDAMSHALLGDDFSKYIDSLQKSNLFSFTLVMCEEVEKVISSLKNKKGYKPTY